jgi:prepilin-type N-terminal cleavage/methylation domain-containing protein
MTCISKEFRIMHPYSVFRRQGGFTLVEIAIVLMIVGLLIGGILRGQELIQSARVRNIIDQKSAIQTAYIGFMDRYRMLPGDLTTAPNGGQAATVGNGAIGSANGGDGVVQWTTESILFFQNLTAAGFISCGACMTVTANGVSNINNSPVNVYGDFLMTGYQTSDNTGVTNWLDANAGISRLILTTGGSVPTQVLAEVDRKADDGLPATGQLRFMPNGFLGPIATCAPSATAVAADGRWANPSQANCQGAWLF